MCWSSPRSFTFRAVNRSFPLLRTTDLILILWPIFFVAATRENPTLKPRNLKKSVTRAAERAKGAGAAIGLPRPLKRSMSTSLDGRRGRSIRPLDQPVERPYWETAPPTCKSARTMVRDAVAVVDMEVGDFDVVLPRSAWARGCAVLRRNRSVRVGFVSSPSVPVNSLALHLSFLDINVQKWYRGYCTAVGNDLQYCAFGRSPMGSRGLPHETSWAHGIPHGHPWYPAGAYRAPARSPPGMTRKATESNGNYVAISYGNLRRNPRGSLCISRMLT